MKLNQTQITEIESYIKRDGIVYYEVYLEILDHMILAVEDIRDAEDISFESAFNKVKEQAFSKSELKKIQKEMVTTFNKVNFRNFKNHLLRQTKPLFFTINSIIFLFLYFSENPLESGVILFYLFTLFCIKESGFIYKNLHKNKLVVKTTSNLLFYYGVVPILLFLILFLLKAVQLNYSVFEVFYSKIIVPFFFVLLYIAMTFNLKQSKRARIIVQQYTA
ncbi:hypothetical protein ACFSX9_07705 [Flavobacterium ardleyense]|uniref:Uncharacterized protein n=1 Tax=Flavobacterium ardleyense TaxID=2038737 RepID=A0ABW5Z7X7_9FLAO